MPGLMMRWIHFATLILIFSLGGCDGVKVDLVMSQVDADGYSVRPLIGVNAGPLRTDAAGDLTDEYVDLGVSMVRTHDFYDALDVSVIFPDFGDPGVYDFSASDPVFDAIVDGGFEPYLRIGESYEAGGAPVPSRDQFDAWAQAAVDIVGHYLDRGSFRYVEIGNEHTNPDFWPRDSSLPEAEQIAKVKEEFHELFILTATALRAAYPELKIGGPGFSPVAASSGGSHWVRDFIIAVRDHRDLVDPGFHIDFVSWHLYSHQPEHYRWVCYHYLDYIADLYMEDVESHITEWNVEHDPETGGDIALTRNTGEGAANLSASWIVMSRFVDRGHFYRGIDARPADDPANPMGYGLLTVDAEYKAIAYAFRLWSEMVQYAANRYELSSTLPGTGIDYDNRWGFYSMAAENGAGDLAVLLANIGSLPVDWKIYRPDGTAAPASAMLIKQIDQDGLYSEFVPTSDRNVIKSDTTQLVLISH